MNVLLLVFTFTFGINLLAELSQNCTNQAACIDMCHVGDSLTPDPYCAAECRKAVSCSPFEVSSPQPAPSSYGPYWRPINPDYQAQLEAEAAQRMAERAQRRANRAQLKANRAQKMYGDYLEGYRRYCSMGTNLDLAIEAHRAMYIHKTLMNNAEYEMNQAQLQMQSATRRMQVALNMPEPSIWSNDASVASSRQSLPPYVRPSAADVCRLPSCSGVYAGNGLAPIVVPPVIASFDPFAVAIATQLRKAKPPAAGCLP